MPSLEPTNIQPKRILVITLRYLGDTLLMTPLLSSLKQAYANAEIDVLLPPSNAGMLEGNPDIHRLITLPAKPSSFEFFKLLFNLWRHYDLAISTQAGDRPILCAVVAGKTSMGFVPADASKAWWKKLLLTRWQIFDADHDHAVLENLRFCELLNIERNYHLTPPRGETQTLSHPNSPYAVLHIMPQWRYKQWHADGWRQLIAFLDKQGYQVALTGSGQAAEMQALQDLLHKGAPDVTNLAGQLSLAQLTDLIAGADLFVGPDTGITHLAAATGTLTFALFGPTDPRKWAPWPRGYAKKITPFASQGSEQVGNVYLIQGQADQNCVPCQLEGCDRHRNSHSRCLDQMTVDRVVDIISQTRKIQKSSLAR